MKIITAEAETAPAFQLTELAPEEDILFFDIETTGFRKESTQVYLIGCAFFSEGTWKIRQYMAESALDERAVLEEFSDFASGFRTLIHFNGEGFDLPYLSYKAEYYGLESDLFRLESIDLYQQAKPLKNLLGLPRMNQKTIEGFLRISREDCLDGGALIPYFYAYEKSGDPEAEKLLLLHNFDDIRGMLKLVGILKYLQIPEGRFTFRDAEVIRDTAVLNYRLEEPLPVAFEKTDDRDRIRIAADGDLLQINIRIYRGQARLPLPDIENYYYLPEEDRIVHKDVACFVDRKKRRKATRKNCFLRKEGLFLPQKRDLFLPAFQVEGEKKTTFFELPDALPEDTGILTEYALDILRA